MTTTDIALSTLLGACIASGIFGWCAHTFVLRRLSYGITRRASQGIPLTEDEEEEYADQGLSSSSPTPDPREIERILSLSEDIRMTMIVRSDLKMTKGKMCAQCGHAVLGCYGVASQRTPSMLHAWKAVGQAKIALKCQSQQELLTLREVASGLGLPTYVVRDAGRTQVVSGSLTVLAIGPSLKSDIDPITSHLKLL